MEQEDETVTVNINGNLYKKRPLFLRVGMGDCSCPQTGNEYELSLINGHTPGVMSKQTKNFFLISWQSIVDAAREAGIDKE